MFQDNLRVWKNDVYFNLDTFTRSIIRFFTNEWYKIKYSLYQIDTSNKFCVNFIFYSDSFKSLFKKKKRINSLYAILLVVI